LTFVEIGDLDFSISEARHARMLSPARERQQLAALLQPAFLSAAEITQDHPFGCALERGHETEHREQSADEPDACVESERGERYRAATDEFENGPRAASFFFRKPCDAGHIGRLFRHFQAIECRAATRGACDTADIARKVKQTARVLDLHEIARNAHCQYG